MQTFNVLDRDLNIHKSYLLEASAGTGKTFSIENIVVRLLLEADREHPPCQLDQILVVTFTRAATQDLRYRIRTNIEKALEQIRNPIDPPSYLKKILEQGEAAVYYARKNLERALFCFSDGQIYTIHSFCLKMLQQYGLEGGITISEVEKDEISYEEIQQIIRDFFRTSVRKGAYTVSQLEILKKNYGSFEALEKKLFEFVKKGLQSGEISESQNLFLDFKKEIIRLKAEYPLNSKDLLNDFELQAPCYKNFDKASKGEILKKVIKFAKIFDEEEISETHLEQLLEDTIVWYKALDPELFKREPKGVLHYPNFRSELRSLHDLIERGSNGDAIFLKMAHALSQQVNNFLKEKEKYRFNDFLMLMQEALKHEPFLEAVQNRFRVAIIDEFQDTDPIQWEIFEQIFTRSPKTLLYLVGDPKQSIYSFRQADIYTYLKAGIKFENRFSLDTNYRSQPSLVEALNLLFSPDNVPDLIYLPKIKQGVPYRQVQFSSSIEEKKFDDQFKSIHFFIAESEEKKLQKKFSLTDLENTYFFPFITQEILKLKQEIPLNQIAILVKDRFQSQRVADFFKTFKIPFVIPKTESLAFSSVKEPLIELLQAVLNPKDLNLIKIALGGSLIGWTYKQILYLEENTLETIVLQFYKLQKSLLTSGFLLFLQLFWESSFDEDHTVLEKLLSKENGEELYRDLQQIGEIIGERQIQGGLYGDKILEFIDSFEHLHFNEDERLNVVQDPSKEGVQIQTIHSSKGLEYGVVFALGLVNQTPGIEDTIPVEQEGRVLLKSISEKNNPHRRQYLAEIDAEKMRQFYVAATRAKYRLYLPVALTQNIPKEGCASPIELFLIRFRQSEFSLDSLYSRFPLNHLDILKTFIKESPNFSYTELNGKQFHISPIQEEKVLKLVPNEIPAVAFKKAPIVSFTALSQQIEKEEEAVLSEFPTNFNSSDKNPYTLPAGSDTGILLHKILEKIPFHNADHAKKIIEKNIEGTAFQSWKEVIEGIISSTLNTPLKYGSEQFCLNEISPSQIIREIEFLYREGDRWVKGVIDAVFVYKDRIFIIDWKSNWLGNSPENYSQSNLEKEMHKNQYFLQAALYKEALQKYLSGYNLHYQFGGVFYFFLRGIDAQAFYFFN